ncbi:MULTISPECIES: hypothetical protein [Actinoalloteichus]|uniref:Uncharacterized protein n=1 Tax=Actinoalloteichus fjordicus TaxID=1612552 RepID=A0AAC9LBH4_9PSEU|nr:MULTISPECIES: hypothetical protein [Actinoalloteichus]APU13289.1 hypothetical protein UA74_06075 [Actinoalloteichus fjordicus]APU19240.1 hypothetical protein UA75_06080 [Actinoalloteichus sp. GBA129-24]
MSARPSPADRRGRRRLVPMLAALLLGAPLVGLLSGCGLSGQVFTIEMHVDGPDQPSAIYYHFAGTEWVYEYQPAASWRKAANIGFGQSDLRVTDPAEGMECTISVNGVEVDRAVAAAGDEELWCGANAQSTD